MNLAFRVSLVSMSFLCFFEIMILKTLPLLMDYGPLDIYGPMGPGHSNS